MRRVQQNAADESPRQRKISMRWMISRGLAFAFALSLFATTATAALPDPITLAWAVERGDLKKVSAWFDEGLDPEALGNQIGTGLMIAAWNGNIEMMQLFVDHGANPRRANRNGEQPLQLAAWNGHLEAVKWLLEHGATINRDGNYWGALHYAVFNGHVALAKYLIERGAEINARSPNGSTPLMMAAREGREELSQTLLDAGADVKARNDWGDSALTLAMRYDHYQLGKMISTAEEFAVAVKAPKESFGAGPLGGGAFRNRGTAAQDPRGGGRRAPDRRAARAAQRRGQPLPAQRLGPEEFAPAGAAALPAQVDRDHRQARQARRRTRADPRRRQALAAFAAIGADESGQGQGRLDHDRRVAAAAAVGRRSRRPHAADSSRRSAGATGDRTAPRAFRSGREDEAVKRPARGAAPSLRDCTFTRRRRESTAAGG
jgi:hypothetical protein